MINLGEVMGKDQQGSDSDVVKYLLNAVHTLTDQVEAVKKKNLEVLDELSILHKDILVKINALDEKIAVVNNALIKGLVEHEDKLDQLSLAHGTKGELLSSLQDQVDKLAKDLNGCKEQFTRTGTATEDFNVLCNLSADGMHLRQLTFRNGQLAFISAESRPKKV